MLLDHSPTPLESLNPLDATTFGIEINEFTFDLLIKKLYSNPIKSIVRELVSNAWDSHTAAGQTHVAVTVNGPTLFDPYFTVHDYGTGLSHEDMTTLYSTLCRSDRRDSNSFLGGFGLGSKSPFAYSDQFTVESRYNGWKRLYAIYKNANNIPTLSLMDTAATDEHNGLTVKIPVHSDDHYKFMGAIQEELLYFPHINTNTPITQPTTLWTSPDHNATLTKTPPYFSGHLYAVVGQVIYSVDHKQLFKNSGNFKEAYYWKCNLFIHCKVGQLSIVPNRETLQYNEATVHHLETAIQKTQLQIDTHIKETISRCPTYNEASKQLGPLRNALHSIGWWKNSYRHPEQPDEPISSYVILPRSKDVDMAITTESRRGHLRINHWIEEDYIRIDTDTEYQILWCPTKTPYLASRLRQVPNNKRQKLVLRGGCHDDLIQQFNDVLTTSVTTIDLTHYHIDSTTTKRNSGTFKTLDNYPVHPNDLHPDYDGFLDILNETANHQQHTYSLYTIRSGNDTLTNFSYGLRYIALIPKSRWNCKATKKLPEALSLIIQRLTELINTYEEDIKNALTLRDISHSYTLIRLAKKYQHDLRHSPFFTGLQQFKETPYHIQNLIQTAYEFRIPLPEPDNTQLEAHNAFYQRYKPFIDYDINVDDHATLLHAYEKYLEQTTDV